MEPKFDIFISYRRKGGYETAKHLYDLLTRDGYRVSFDIDTLRSGDFDAQLLERIDQCKDFILILNQDAFGRTLDSTFDPKQDWLRCELAYALKKEKNIIPVFLAGVKGFPEGLPSDVAGVTRKNGPEYNLYYFDDFYHRLKERFLFSKPHARITKFNIKRNVRIIIFLILLGIFCSVIWKILSPLDSISLTQDITRDSIGGQLKNVDFLSDYKELKIGDYLYEDGTFSHLLSTEKKPVGVLFTRETTAEERSHGWTHGEIIAMEDCGKGNYYQWYYSDELVLPYPFKVNECENAKLNVNDKQGYLYTYNDITQSDEFQAFAAARRYKPQLSFGSRWYLPSLGQWLEIVENLGGVKTYMEITYSFDVETAYSNLKKYGVDNDYYWTSTVGGYCAWVIYLGEGSVNGYTSRQSRCRVRAIAAF